MKFPRSLFPSHPKAPLIDRPSRQGTRQRQLFLALNALAWVVWIYLWTPMFAAFLYGLGLSSFTEASPLWSGSVSINFLIGISIGCFLFTFGWVNYKSALHAWKIPRRQWVSKSWSDIMNQQGLDDKSVDHLTLAQRAVIHFDELGTPVRVLAQVPLLEDQPLPIASNR